jgi:hypothetical protein
MPAEALVEASMPSELEAIKHVLRHDWDPLGLSNWDGAESHYDPFAIGVFKMLEENAGAGDVANYLTRVVTTELLIPANPGFDSAIAAKVVAIYRRSDRSTERRMDR